MHSPSAIVYPANGNLYLNLTNRCSCDCTFCLRRFTWEVYGYDLRLGREPDTQEVLAAVAAEVDRERPHQLVFCGLGEPTLRLETVLEVTRAAAGDGLAVRLDTNGCGQLSAPGLHVVAALAEAGLAAASVSLNAPDAETYERLCRPRYSGAYTAVVRFAADCVEAGVETTLSALDGLGVDLEACAAVAADVGADFRVRGRATPRLSDRPTRRPIADERRPDGHVRGYGARGAHDRRRPGRDRTRAGPRTAR